MLRSTSLTATLTPHGPTRPWHVDPILPERATAKWLSVSVSTLQRWRAKGEGPSWVRLSERGIGYRASAVEGWLAQAEVTPQGNTTHVTPRGNAPGWWGQPPSGNCGPSASIRSVGLLRDRAAVQVPGAKPDEEPSS